MIDVIDFLVNLLLIVGLFTLLVTVLYALKLVFWDLRED